MTNISCLNGFQSSGWPALPFYTCQSFNSTIGVWSSITYSCPSVNNNHICYFGTLLYNTAYTSNCTIVQRFQTIACRRSRPLWRTAPIRRQSWQCTTSRASSAVWALCPPDGLSRRSTRVSRTTPPQGSGRPSTLHVHVFYFYHSFPAIYLSKKTFDYKRRVIYANYCMFHSYSDFNILQQRHYADSREFERANAKSNGEQYHLLYMQSRIPVERCDSAVLFVHSVQHYKWQLVKYHLQLSKWAYKYISYPVVNYFCVQNNYLFCKNIYVIRSWDYDPNKLEFFTKEKIININKI